MKSDSIKEKEDEKITKEFLHSETSPAKQRHKGG